MALPVDVPVARATRYDGAAVDEPGLADALLRLWVDVTNAGGAVGFVPPVTGADVAPDLDRALGAVRAGVQSLVVLREGERVVAVGYLRPETHRLKRHWAWVVKVMVAPDRQGRGHGLAVLEAVADAARADGLEAVLLSARGGLGLERFYARAGFVEVGRVPGALRVAAGDDRDEVLLQRRLAPPAS